MSSNLNDIYASVYNYITSRTSVMNYVTAVYYFEAPDNAVYPYVVYRRTADQNWDFFSEYGNIFYIRFEMFDDDDSATNINNIESALINDMRQYVDSTVYYDSVCVKRINTVEDKIDNVWRRFVTFALTYVEA